jgi:hypothetical protein
MNARILRHETYRFGSGRAGRDFIINLNYDTAKPQKLQFHKNSSLFFCCILSCGSVIIILPYKGESMCKRCLFAFLAGAAAWNALSHFVIALFFNQQPIQLGTMVLTQNLNYLLGAISLAAVGLFLYLASDKQCACNV